MLKGSIGTIEDVHYTAPHTSRDAAHARVALYNHYVRYAGTYITRCNNMRRELGIGAAHVDNRSLARDEFFARNGIEAHHLAVYEPRGTKGNIWTWGWTFSLSSPITKLKQIASDLGLTGFNEGRRHMGDLDPHTLAIVCAGLLHADAYTSFSRGGVVKDNSYITFYLLYKLPSPAMSPALTTSLSRSISCDLEVITKAHSPPHIDVVSSHLIANGFIVSTTHSAREVTHKTYRATKGDTRIDLMYDDGGSLAYIIPGS